MDLGLNGKVVVITGGTRGIGKGCADAFFAEGCKVVVCGRSETKLAAFRKEYAEKPMLALQADITRPEEMEQLAARAVETFGGIDVWVNNAGIYPTAELLDMPLAEWRNTFAVNVDGVLHGCRAAYPHMLRRGGGVIINASSFASILPTAGRGAYGVTKAAVQHLTRVLGAELAKDDIRVVSYLPGFLATNLTSSVTADTDKEILFSQAAQHRYGTVEEVASVVVFLASKQASFITGSGIEVSGGKYCVQNPWHAWKKK